MTAARGLALELWQLAPRQREQLLAELPAERRAQMEALLREIAGILHPSANSFDRQLALAADEPVPSPLAGLSDYQLRLLMSSDHSSVQRRIASAIRKGELTQLAPAVAKAVTEYLSQRLQASELRSDEPRPRVEWWRKWRKSSR